MDLGRDAEGSIYETLFDGDLAILQAMPIPGESALMLGLSKIGNKFLLKELPILGKFGKLNYNKETKIMDFFWWT